MSTSYPKQWFLELQVFIAAELARPELPLPRVMSGLSNLEFHPKTCLSCGSKQNGIGQLPCGH